MLKRLADAGIRNPRRTGLIALLLLVVTGAVGGMAPDVLKARNDFEDPSSESASARKQLERASGEQPVAGVLALVKAPPRSVAVTQTARKLDRDPAVARVLTYAKTHDPRLLSRDGRSTLIAAPLRSNAQTQDAIDRLEETFKGDKRVVLGGSDVAMRQVDEQAAEDLGLAETLVFPLLALLAFLVFRGVAVLLPLTVGVLSVFGTFTTLVAVNEALPLSVFALNLVFGLGLGLAVDYSLFIVSRFREELGRGAAVSAAIRTTMATAGRTVLFSALTVAAASATLVVFPLRFLQSMGIAGAAVALIAAAMSLVFLPSILMLLGRRIGRHVPPAEEEGRWYRVSHAVMRRPGAIAGLTIVALVIIALPSLRTQWTWVDVSILPTTDSARVVGDRLDRDFKGIDESPMVVAISAPRSAEQRVAAYVGSVRRVPGLTGVTRPRYVGHGAWELEASVPGSPVAQPAQRAVARVRALPRQFPVAVGGDAAEFADVQAAIRSNLVLALTILVFASILLFWVLTGSVVLPIKALVMNALTAGVATGALVWVFQDGRLEGLLSYNSQGAIELADFLVLVVIAFALSTDYGVFLLTRIKEARDSGVGERESIAVGLQRSGKIVSAASVLLAVALGAFVTSHLIFLKELGVGLAVAVLIDAFIVRALLVPSLMALLGSWNWWQPRALARLHARIGAHERQPERAGALTGSAVT